METLIASLISGGLTLIGTVITVHSSTKKTEQTLKTEIAVMNTRIDGLTKEVEKHNGFAERVPRLETTVETLEGNVQQLQGFHMHA